MKNDLIEHLLQKKPFIKNLASYTTTIMSEKYSRIINAGLPYNLANRSIYKELEQMEEHCIDNMATMFNAVDTNEIKGFSTVGSSEAILIYLLVLKTTFANSFESPNIVISQHTHFSWNFAASILGISVKTVSVNEAFNVDEVHLNQMIDKSTLAVILTAGTTLTGAIENVEMISNIIRNFNQANNTNIYIHIDAAIGGFIFPFISKFKLNLLNLDNVNSINVSSHKYGGVYPSCGWLVLKQNKFDYDKLSVMFDYLFNSLSHMAINFSMPAAFIMCQYEIFTNEPQDFYQNRTNSYFEALSYLENSLENIGVKIINKQNVKTPVIVFDIENLLLKQQFSKHMLDKNGWYIPFYTIATAKKSCQYHRVVIKDNFCNKETIDSFMHDVKSYFALNTQ